MTQTSTAATATEKVWAYEVKVGDLMAIGNDFAPVVKVNSSSIVIDSTAADTAVHPCDCGRPHIRRISIRSPRTLVTIAVA